MPKGDDAILLLSCSIYLGGYSNPHSETLKKKKVHAAYHQTPPNLFFVPSDGDLCPEDDPSPSAQTGRVQP